MIYTLFIRARDFGCVGHVDLALVRIRLYAILSSIAPTLTSSQTGRRLRSLLRLRGLALSLRRLLRRLCNSSLLYAGVFLVVRVKPTLPIKNGVSFLITRWAAELGRTRAAKPRVFPRTERALWCRGTLYTFPLGFWVRIFGRWWGCTDQKLGADLRIFRI
jgi:hypothetical protein